MVCSSETFRFSFLGAEGSKKLFNPSVNGGSENEEETDPRKVGLGRSEILRSLLGLETVRELFKGGIKGWVWFKMPTSGRYPCVLNPFVVREPELLPVKASEGISKLFNPRLSNDGDQINDCLEPSILDERSEGFSWARFRAEGIKKLFNSGVSPRAFRFVLTEENPSIVGLGWTKILASFPFPENLSFRVDGCEESFNVFVGLEKEPGNIAWFCRSDINTVGRFPERSGLRIYRREPTLNILVYLEKYSRNIAGLGRADIY